ncbi:hypothetical protein EJB05_36424, partial [Eragrostis curvula]
MYTLTYQKVTNQKSFYSVFTILMVSQVLGEQDCYGEKVLVKERCMKSIKLGEPYIPPTQSCIRAVEKSDMTCICRILTTEDQLEISVAKTLRLADECNKPVPAGSKCGNPLSV